MKISYAICVKDEFVEVQKLVNFLRKNKRTQDEIVILYDSKNGTLEVENYLKSHSADGAFQLQKGKFNNHFAEWKNKLAQYCKGDYIFSIDADELPHKTLIDNLPTILESNPNNEVYLVPRINTVTGISKRHIEQWGWRVDKIESLNLIEEKEMDTESEEYQLLKQGGFIIKETRY